MSSALPGPAGACPRARDLVVYGDVIKARCQSRSCPSCGVLWLGDTRIRTLAGCQTLKRAVALVTVTAPGKHVLPWDPATGKVDAHEARLWNESAPERWTGLHAAAARVARAVAREAGAEWYLICRVWEYQKRGVLHLHLLVPCGTSGERLASEAYVRELAARAPRESFGFVDRGRLPERGARQSARRLCPVSPHRAAAYVAAYVASTGAGKEGVAEVARKQGVPGPIVYVSRRLTQASGVTMRSLRARRRLLCAFPDSGATADAWRAATVVDGLRRSRAPFTTEHRKTLYARALSEHWAGGIDARTGEVLSPTDAALPPRLLEEGCCVTPSGVRGVVRLDCVPHHDYAGRQTGAVRTQPRVVGLG